MLDLLPAVPRSWPGGEVKGLRARGGFEVGLTWTDNALIRVEIHSLLGRPCRLQAAERSVDLTTEAGKSYVFDGKLQPVM